LAAVITAGASCSSGHRTDPTTTTPATSTTFSPTGSNPDVIPSVITPAYVDAVFKVLNHIKGAATRELYASGSVDQKVRVDLRSIFNDPLYRQELSNAAASLSVERAALRNPIGDVITSVKRVVSASSQCVFVETVSDFSLVDVHPSQAASEYWVLTPKVLANDPSGLNSTPWAISFNADYLTPTSIPDQCVGR
jgi:hypothetical protein